MTQLAAVGPNGTFNRYMLPINEKITPEASELTGITVEDDKMYLNGKEVATVPKRQVLYEFVQYLVGNKPVLLVGHNIRNNDATMLYGWSLNEKINLTKVVHGFLDTLPMFKAAHKKLPSYKQGDLYRHFFSTEEDCSAHNALDDVLTLKRLVEHACPDLAKQRPYTFQIPYLEDLRNRSFKRLCGMSEWREPISKKFITKYIANKAIDSGLKLKHLRTAYRRNGEEGLIALLSQAVDGKPRVTKSKAVIDKLIPFFQISNEM